MKKQIHLLKWNNSLKIELFPVQQEIKTTILVNLFQDYYCMRKPMLGLKSIFVNQIQD